MSVDNSGCAFPHIEYMEDGSGRIQYQDSGASLRDYFAAKALQGLCANPNVFAANQQTGWGLVNATGSQLSSLCLELADSVLMERTK